MEKRVKISVQISLALTYKVAIFVQEDRILELS